MKYKYAFFYDIHGDDESLGNSAVLFKTLAEAKEYAELFTSPPMRKGNGTIYSLTQLWDGGSSITKIPGETPP